MNKWFQTWGRPEYQEWASPVAVGYGLLIIRREKDKYLCVKARLIMGDTGLPKFEVVQEQRFSTKQEAIKKIQMWKTGFASKVGVLP